MTIPRLDIPRCKNFSGYKPCLSYVNCLANGCQQESAATRPGTRILIISLDAMGNVLDNTSILPAVKRKYPESTVYWITMENARNILIHNPFIDRVFVWTDEDRMILRAQAFDLILNADKTDYACAFAGELKAPAKLGFLLNADGKIVPANDGALYNYRMGNDDELKFRKNTRTGIDIIHETFELQFRRDEYTFALTEEERHFAASYAAEAGIDGSTTVVGFNTGCSNLFPNKKMTIAQHCTLIAALAADPRLTIVLLGGREDTERNEQILSGLDPAIRRKVVSTPTTMGLRKGACFMACCDVVITGDSFGMHLAIALRKYIIAWFGLSCWSEIELYGRGEKLIPHGLACAPCWKKVCPYHLECIDMIDLDRITDLVRSYAAAHPPAKTPKGVS